MKDVWALYHNDEVLTPFYDTVELAQEALERTVNAYMQLKKYRVTRDGSSISVMTDGAAGPYEFARYQIGALQVVDVDPRSVAFRWEYDELVEAIPIRKPNAS